LQLLPGSFRRTGERVRSVETGRREDHEGTEFVSRYGKTEMSDRHFCKKCGDHVLVAHPALGLTHVYPASFPTLTFKPTVHLNYAETVLPMKDGLRKLRDFPAEACGSGETLPE
jgi:hypothetical protein